CSSVFTARATAEIYTLSLHDALPIFGVARRIENALDMAAVGQDEATVAAEQQGRAIDRVPGRNVIVDAGHAEAVDVDLGQVHRRAADLQPTGAAEWVVLEEVDQVAMQGGGQAGVVVVPVEDVERRWLPAEQVSVDTVTPDQVVGAHPGEHPGHAAAIQHTLLIGAALGRLQGLLVGKQHRRAVDLAVEQADHVGGAGNLAHLPARLQVPQHSGDGQAASAGAEQVEVLAASDGAAGVDGFAERLHLTRQTPFAVLRARIAPADHEGLQLVLQRVL